MLIIPIRSDRPQKHIPWVNYALIAINVIVFIINFKDIANAHAAMNSGQYPLGLIAQKLPVIKGYLWPGDMFSFKQLITYQFLHLNWQHLGGNMIFLYVFGNSLEDRLGKFGYLMFYLAAGVIAGLGHAMVETSPILGASGSVAGVTGAYLVLFPKANITLFFWFLIFVDTFLVSSLVLICFQIGQDALFYIVQFGGVAYLAHLSGNAFGILMAFGLLRFGVLKREPYDLLALIKQRKRRSTFRNMAKKGYQPWEAGPFKMHRGKNDDVDDDTSQPADAKQQQVMDIRSKINKSISDNIIGEAARQYCELLEVDGGQVMGQQHQLDIANQLMSDKAYEIAATAYELFLNTYGSYSDREQVELILGLIYARYLDRKQRAGELLKSAANRLRDPQQKQLAESILAEIG